MKTVFENEVRPYRLAAELVWDQWTRMWNGELNLAEEIIASRFGLFLTAAVEDDQAAINDAKKVAAFVGRVRDSFSSIRYNSVAGPYVDTESEVLSCYWEARGVYAGKTGRPEDVQGKSFHLVGIDLLQLKDGKISSCRTMSNPARPE